MTGKSHQVSGLPCQDNHSIIRADNGWVIAAVADGVGSAERSGRGSRIAAETAAGFCARYLPWDESVIGIKSMLRTAFNHAFKCILREAEKTGNPVESYDTTLSVAVFDGHQLIYGHSGDGGIIGLSVSGEYLPITHPQKGADGISVIPLRAGYTRWMIDRYDGELAGVLLLTDGMLDIITPALLKNSDDERNGVYVPLASFFLDPYGFDGSEKEQREQKARIKCFMRSENESSAEAFDERISGIYKKRTADQSGELLEGLRLNSYPYAFMQNVRDDKTAAALINPEAVIADKERNYYAEPDWLKIRDEWNRKAYPHLYSNETQAC